MVPVLASNKDRFHDSHRQPSPESRAGISCRCPNQGVSLDALVADLLVSNAPLAESSQHPELIEELGIPVLRTGQPIDPSAIADTLDRIRQERDVSVLEQC
jgi:hypothetical protein